MQNSKKIRIRWTKTAIVMLVKTIQELIYVIYINAEKEPVKR